MKKFSLEEIIVFGVAALLPTYLLRFHVGPIPMTVLEVVELGAIAALIWKITHPTLSYNKRGIESVPPLKIRGGRGRYDSFFGDNNLLSIGSLLILLATIIGVAVAPDMRAALGIAKAYFWEPMMLAWLLIAAKPDREKIFRAARCGFAVSAGIVIAYGLIQFAVPELIPATWTAERRITSVFGYPNALALYLAPLLPLFLSNIRGILLAIFAFAAIVLAKSAGGLVASAAALFGLGIMGKKTRIAAIVVALAAAVTVFALPQLSGLRSQLLMQDWSGRVHRIGWSESFAMLKDNPFAGAGLSGFPIAVAPYHTAQGVEIFQYPHNLFLAIWSELGLLGLIGFALVLIWFFARRRVMDHGPHTMDQSCPWSIVHGPLLLAALIAILVQGLVDVPYFKNDLAMMFWLFAAIIAL